LSGSCSSHGAHSHQLPQYVPRLWGVILLVAGYCVLEVVGGLWTGSLALLADAGHMASDLISLLASLGAAWLAMRRPSKHQTFGLHRAEILAALFNGVLLFVVAGGILWEAVERLLVPQPILSGAMLLIACGGLAVNLASLSILHGDRNHNLNMRGAWLHILGDTLGSVAVISAALLIWLFNWNWADPVASVLACIIILYSAKNLVRDAVWILMEYAPLDISIEDLQQEIQSVSGVEEIHRLHFWTITSGRNALTLHVTLAPDASFDTVLNELNGRLQNGFHLEHLTMQVEPAGSRLCSQDNRDHSHDHDHAHDAECRTNPGVTSTSNPAS